MNNIEERIKNCKNLLNLFRKERRLFLARETVNMQDVLPILKLKKDLVDVLDGANLLSANTENASAEDPKEELQRKEQLRELAGLLEELLVIDRENEMLLRKLLNKPSTAAKKAPAKPRKAVDNAAPGIGRSSIRRPGVKSEPAAASPKNGFFNSGFLLRPSVKYV